MAEKALRERLDALDKRITKLENKKAVLFEWLEKEIDERLNRLIVSSDWNLKNSAYNELRSLLSAAIKQAGERK